MLACASSLYDFSGLAMESKCALSSSIMMDVSSSLPAIGSTDDVGAGGVCCCGV